MKKTFILVFSCVILTVVFSLHFMEKGIKVLALNLERDFVIDTTTWDTIIDWNYTYDSTSYGYVKSWTKYYKNTTYSNDYNYYMVLIDTELNPEDSSSTSVYLNDQLRVSNNIDQLNYRVDYEQEIFDFSPKSALEIEEHSYSIGVDTGGVGASASVSWETDYRYVYEDSYTLPDPNRDDMDITYEYDCLKYDIVYLFWYRSEFEGKLYEKTAYIIRVDKDVYKVDFKDIIEADFVKFNTILHTNSKQTAVLCLDETYINSNDIPFEPF